MNDVTELSHRVSAALERLDSPFTVAECHGALVGMLCAQAKLGQDEWLAQIAPATAGDLLLAEARDSLAQLFGETTRQLNDPVLEFQPLVPEEGEPLRERVEALGDWCQGFLLGLSEGGVKDTERLPDDAAEVVRDLVNISRVASYEMSDSNEDEEAYTELLEYVRAGVLLVNEELNPTKAAPRGDTTLH